MNKAFDPDAFMLAAATNDLRRFVSRPQLATLRRCAKGEEGVWFIARMVELAAEIAAMPKTYEQDGKGDAAIVHLHYFTASADWYITERDMETEQHQAFGLADLFRDGGELGYISIVELIQHNAELDLHWTPRPLAVYARASASSSIGWRAARPVPWAI